MSETPTESAIRIRTAAVGVAAFAIALGYFALFLSYGINVPDEGALLYGFERIADGQRPYRDVHLGYTPGVYYLHAALQGAFSQSIIPGRIALALANAAAVGLLAALTYPLCGALPALLAALFYLAAMPVHPGYFAAFNVPYPSWYATLLFVAGLHVVRAHLVRPTLALSFTAGALAALAFAFKPNVGALQLACAMLLVLASLSPGAAGGGSSLPAKLWWWATWVAVLPCVLAMFGMAPVGPELALLLLPAFAAALLAARCAHTTGAVADVRRIASHTVGVVVGFAAFTAPWVAWFAAPLSLDEVFEKVLFVSSSYSSRFYQPHPPLLLGVCAVVVAYVAASAAARFVPRERRASLMILCGISAVAVLAIVAATSPMIEGFERAVMLPFEMHWAYVLAVAASVLGVGEAWRATQASPAPGDSATTHATLTTLAIGAPFLYLHIYPRTDFMHWVTAAPVAMAQTVVLALLIARRWTGHSGWPARATAAALVVSPLILVAVLRTSSGLGAIFEVEGGRLQSAAAVALASERAPVWNNVGRARSYDALSEVVELVRRNTEPGDTVATFPALDMVSFLSDRDGPYLDGYWFPGWRSHDDEARAIAAMERHPPRLVVLDTAPQTYFSSAPVYFSRLMDFFESAYRPFARVGSYSVLAHREHGPMADRFADDRTESRLETLRSYLEAKLSTAQPQTLSCVVDDLSDDFIEGYADPLIGLLADKDAAVRAATVRALRSAGDPKTALALARAAIDGGLDERSRRLALRLASAWADEESEPLWLAHVDDSDSIVASTARMALANVAKRASFRSSWPNGTASATPPRARAESP